MARHPCVRTVYVQATHIVISCTRIHSKGGCTASLYMLLPPYESDYSQDGYRATRIHSAFVPECEPEMIAGLIARPVTLTNPPSLAGSRRTNHRHPIPHFSFGLYARDDSPFQRPNSDNFPNESDPCTCVEAASRTELNGGLIGSAACTD